MRGSSSLLHSTVNVVRMQLNWNVPHFNIGGVFAIFAAVHKPHVEGGDDTAVHKHQGQQTNQNPHELMGLRGRR